MKKNINVRRASALRIRQKNLEFWKKLVIDPSYTDSSIFEKVKSEKIKVATKEIAILKERVANG